LESYQVGFGLLPDRTLAICTTAQSTLESAKTISLYAWSHLDSDQDGSVSCSDIKESLRKSYTFAMSLSWEDIKNHKLTFYKNAISYMREELENDKKCEKIVEAKIFST
jgi:hypothetical protein